MDVVTFETPEVFEDTEKCSVFPRGSEYATDRPEICEVARRINRQC